MATIISSSSSSSSSNSSAGMKDKTLTGIGSLIKLLPTGTVFIFQFLSPVLTNNGQCHTSNKILSSVLAALCGFSCVFSTFTDSYTDHGGKLHYGIATLTGLWPSSSSGVDLSKYKLRVGDLVHALLALLVFSVLVLLDGNVVECFYPSFESTERALLMALPPIIGTFAGSVFMMFPNTRHGIGYPRNSGSSSTSTADDQIKNDGNDKTDGGTDRHEV